MTETEDTYEAGVKAAIDDSLEEVKAQLEAIAPGRTVRGVIVDVLRTSHCKCEAAQVLGIKKKELKLLMKSLDIKWQQ